MKLLQRGNSERNRSGYKLHKYLKQFLQYQFSVLKLCFRFEIEDNDSKLD